jgi:2-C-methyl-D-erythritol 4-phosphate cytidylyltransferase
VTIWNTGPEGVTFHPELFGPYITIHRTLNARGSTLTKVLDARGNKTNMTKAEDVKRMLSSLSVNAANPSIVLTQDHARGLLSGDKVNRKLYELLMESLGFDATLAFLNDAKEKITGQNKQVRSNKGSARVNAWNSAPPDVMP